ncbi:MAG TPA: BON domain-containing protein [Terriglobia bacterium]|nr:BON domain-containing protein [Terriglobia bacterium]
MKKLMFTCVVLFCIATAAAAADLTREQRAKIERQLLSELSPTVGVFDYVAFQLDEKGTVTLLGQVRDPNLKKHAEEDARKVEGVARVRNQIEVLPVSPSDDQIRRAVYTAIYSQNGFERYVQRAVPPVHIIVKNGSVRLEGNLANKLEYAQMEAAVKGVPGVFSVTNNVRIDAAG